MPVWVEDAWTRVPPEYVVSTATLPALLPSAFFLMAAMLLGDVSAVFFVCLGVAGDIAAGFEHAQVVVEGGHVEVRHGDARRLQGVLEVGLCDAAAAAGVCTSQDDEVRVEGDDGLRVERREIADLFRLGFDVVIGKCIAGRADEHAAGKLPDVRKAAHARYDALVGAHGYLVA